MKGKRKVDFVRISREFSSIW